MLPFYLSLLFVNAIDATVGGRYPNEVSGLYGTRLDGARHRAGIGCGIDKGIANLTMPPFVEGLVVEGYQATLGSTEDYLPVGQQGGRGHIDAIIQIFSYDCASGLCLQDEERIS